MLHDEKLQARNGKLRFGKSPIHAWGVFAAEAIAKDELLVEYRGELVGNAVANKREKLYERQGQDDYQFRIDPVTVCDATRRGSLARFLNHSCGPNCYTKIISHEGTKKIMIYAGRDIMVGEELCYDCEYCVFFVAVVCARLIGTLTLIWLCVVQTHACPTFIASHLHLPHRTDKFPYETDASKKIACHCGAEACCGFMN